MNNIIFIGESIPYTKLQQSGFVETLISKMENGEVNPVEAVIKAKALYETISLFLKDNRTNEFVLSEFSKYGKGEVPSFAGATIQIRETGVKYDYMNCGDPEYTSLLKQEQEISEARKKREKYLSTIKKSKTELDEETGEIYVLKPPIRSGKTSFVVIFKKE